MKQPLKLILTLAAAISAVAQTIATIKPKQSAPFDPPRSIQISEKDIPTVYGCDGQLLMISMPDQELIRVAGFADADNWKVAVDQAARGQMLIKFGSILTTSALLQVTSNRNYGYTILVEANAGHCDTRVKLVADEPLNTKIKTIEPWVSPEAAAALKAKAEQAEKEAQMATENAKAEKANFQQQYTHQLEFDYNYDKKQAAKFQIESIGQDGKFTYIWTHAKEPPAFYEIKAGKPSLIQFDFAKGVYTTARVVDEGYLVIGGNGNGKHQQKLMFKRTVSESIGAGTPITAPSGN